MTDTAVAASVTSPEATDPRLYRDAALRRILTEVNAGQSLDGAIRTAMQEGIDEATARSAATEVKNQIVKAYKDRALRGMGFAALWFFGGLAVTGGTYYLAATNGGSSYFITWGAVIFGGLRLVTNGFSYLTAGSKVS